MTTLESIKVLGITADTLFERVQDPNRERARFHLDVFDLAVAALESLTAELAAMTARVQALTDTETKLRSVIEMNIETIDFVTARAELAERQVKLLIPFVTRACPPAGHVRNVRGCASSYSCDGCWDEWSREAAKGVQG